MLECGNYINRSFLLCFSDVRCRINYNRNELFWHGEDLNRGVAKIKSEPLSLHGFFVKHVHSSFVKHIVIYII